MKTGILTSGVSQDFERALKIIHEDGFEYVELQFMWGTEVCHHSDKQNEQMKYLLEQYQIKVSAVLKNLFTGMIIEETELTSPEYLEQIKILKKSIELARFFGTNITRTNTFNKRNVIFGKGGAEIHLSNQDKIWYKFLKLMEPCCQIAEDEEIDLMMETGTNGFIHSAALAKKAIDALGSKRLKVLWDPANCMYSMEEPFPEGYEAIKGHIAEIHVKDLRIDKKTASITYCPLGKGIMTPYMEELATELKRDKWDGVIVFENQVTPPGQTEEDGYYLSIPTFKEMFG